MGLSFRWRIVSALLASGLGASGAPLYAQAPGPVTTVVEPPTPLLPTNPLLQPAGAAGAIPPETPQAQGVLKEDGLKRTESRVVVSPVAHATTPAGYVTVYEFVDATGAYAAYTYLRVGGRPVAHGVNASEFRTPSGEQVFLAGTSVVRARTDLPTEQAGTLLKAVETGLPKIGGRKGLRPLLPTLFPAKGYDASTLRYALGPIGYAALGGVFPAGSLGWDKDAEVGVASYNGGRQTLTLLLYPTPEIAGIYGRNLQDYMNAKGPASFGTVKMKRLGPLVGVTTGDWAAKQALDTLAALNLRQEVTFDKPMPLEFHAEVRKTATLLQSIAIFTGIGALAAVVLAVFFGFGRAGLRVLQGKPAASEPEFLTINLRDKPKGLFAPRAQPERHD